MNILDYIGLALTFMIIIYIGINASKKIKNEDDFLLAGKGLGKMQAGLSLAATDLGGASLIGSVAYVIAVGASGVWYCWTTVPVYILFGLFFIHKLYPLALHTLPEFFEKRYSGKTRLLASIMHIAAIIGILSAQFTVSATALNIVLGVPIPIGFAISMLIVLVYTAAGGLLAVVNTDVFQYFLIMIFVIIMAPLSVGEAGGVANIISSIPKDFTSLGSTGIWVPVSWMLWGVFAYPTNQQYLQRVFASKNKSTAKFSFCFTGINFFVLGIATTAIGLAALIILPNIADANTAYPILLTRLLPNGLAGLALGGILAATMSSADSLIMAVTTLFVTDIYKPYLAKEDHTEKYRIFVSRILTVVSCALAIVIALISKNLLQIVFIAGLFYSASVFYPLMLGIFWKRANEHGAFFGMVVAIVLGAIVEFDLFGISTGFFALPSNIVGSTAGLITIVVVSLLTKKPNPSKLEILEKTA